MKSSRPRPRTACEGGALPPLAALLAALPAVLLAIFSSLSFSGCAGPLEAVKLRVGHRVFPGFHEETVARPGERFQIGDTDYFGRVIRFVPDFAFDDKSKKVVSRTNELRNPAIQLEVWQGEEELERTWAFRSDMPHYSEHAMLSFQIDSLIWKDGRSPYPLPVEGETK